MHTERLETLANHLLNGSMFHEKFNLEVFVSPLADDEGHPCGTQGCALGECPHLFKDDWIWVGGYPVLASKRTGVKRKQC